MSRKSKHKHSNKRKHHEHEKEKMQEQEKLSPDSPASSRQKELLHRAIRENWLTPNPFERNYSKWENLTAGEADKLLATLSPERLGKLEEDMRNTDRLKDRGIARAVGRGIEDEIKGIGHSIDGGIS